MNVGDSNLVDLFVDSVHMNLKHAVFICITVRLAGSRLPYEGRLEVYYNGSWGTVCYYSFDSTDATVACRSIFGSGLFYFLCSLSLVTYLFNSVNDKRTDCNITACVSAKCAGVDNAERCIEIQQKIQNKIATGTKQASASSVKYTLNTVCLPV